MQNSGNNIKQFGDTISYKLKVDWTGEGTSLFAHLWNRNSQNEWHSFTHGAILGSVFGAIIGGAIWGGWGALIGGVLGGIGGWGVEYQNSSGSTIDSGSDYGSTGGGANPDFRSTCH